MNPRSTAIGHLETLAEALAPNDELRVLREFDIDVPVLSVANTDMRDGRGWELLSGVVLVGTGRDGRSWFYWDSGDALGPADGLDDAVQRVLRALTIREPA
ncbi:hypothetical protein [Spirillospora sp. NBC_01491]|uniref:hypothetical protein n=1 Tax=Spirillospora sp. NBC_01491 TaxID=2976007 RepID=UPI002E30BDE2|nr:hypothetical protein [Spirillospora sp. NBC_01491]